MKYVLLEFNAYRAMTRAEGVEMLEVFHRAGYKIIEAISLDHATQCPRRRLDRRGDFEALYDALLNHTHPCIEWAINLLIYRDGVPVLTTS